MRRLLQSAITLTLIASAAAPTASAQNAEACQSIEFSSRVLERAPQIREACLDVVTRGNEQYAVIKSDLIGATRHSIRVRFKRPDGSAVESRTIAVSPGFRVLIDGKPTRIGDLAIGQELTAYVKVSEPMVALDPGTDEQPLEPPLQTEEPAVPTLASEPLLPHTAGLLPELAVGGFLLLLVGCVLSLDSLMHSRRRSPSRRTEEPSHE